MAIKDIAFDIHLQSTERQFQFKREVAFTNDQNSVRVIFNIKDMTDSELTSATADVLLYMRDGSFYQIASSNVQKNGTQFSYVLKDNEGKHNGVVKAQLVVKFTGEKRLASRKCEFEIETGLDNVVATEVMIQDWSTLTQQAQEYIDEFVANEADRQSGEDVRIENEQARQLLYDELLETGVLQTNINEKLQQLEEEYAPKLTEVTTQLAQNVKFEGQADYVDMIKNLTGYKRLRVKRTDNSTPTRLDNYLIDVVLDDGEKHITHQWKKNNNDDLYIYSNAFVGVLGRTVFTKNIPTLNGSFNTDSVATLTTTIGDSFEAFVNGDEIVFNHYADHRGGLWEFVINDDNFNKIQVSTYNPSINSVKSVILKKGLVAGRHKVVATFLGDDPEHPITTEKSRGWIRYSTTATADNDFSLIGYTQGNAFNAGQGDLLAAGSNKEFAITGVKDGKTNWFPEHNQIGTCFAIVPNRYLLDGKEIDFSEYMDKEFIEGNSNFKIIQQMYFQFPDTTEQIAKLSMVVTINMDGVVAISGGLEVLSDFTATGYAMMFPLGRGVNEFVSSIGNSKLNAADESIYNMAEEKDLTYSFAGISPVNRDYISAMTVDFPSTTLRQGKQGRREDLSRFTYIHQRALFPKLYQVSLENAELVVGDRLKFHGRFTIGEIPNIYDVIKP